LRGGHVLTEPAMLAAAGRWELGKTAHEAYGYRTPATADIERHTLKVLSDRLFEDLLSRCQGNPIEVFRKMLSQRIPAIEDAIESALSEAAADGKQIEAILTWCNCPSLSAVAKARGLDVVHIEVGPLRAPEYRPTAYVDFSGVNGNTEAGRRYFALDADGSKIDTDALLNFFYLGEKLSPLPPSKLTGVPLQVEDDSNLVAFGNGFDNQSAVVYAKLFFEPAGPVRVRSHPGSLFWTKPGHGFEPDDSRDSIEFIRRCARIVTINSSVGLEAILMGVPVLCLGECSYKFILDDVSPDEMAARLAYYLFAYLVPRELLFDLRYLRFRIAKPTEAQIVGRHIEMYERCEGMVAAGGSTVWDLIESAIRNG
jgi:hypothetical protein